jgi:hypothetical protein
MKIKVVEKTTEKKFTPITVEITFETLDDLANMFARTNASPSKISYAAPTGFESKITWINGLHDVISELWNKNK